MPNPGKLGLGEEGTQTFEMLTAIELYLSQLNTVLILNTNNRSMSNHKYSILIS